MHARLFILQKKPGEKVRICLKNEKNRIFKNRITIGFSLNVPPSNKAIAPEIFSPKIMVYYRVIRSKCGFLDQTVHSQK